MPKIRYRRVIISMLSAVIVDKQDEKKTTWIWLPQEDNNTQLRPVVGLDVE